MKSTKALYSVIFTLAFALILSLGLTISTAQAASGDLDPTFGGDGLVTTNFFGSFDVIHDIAIQPDGKIVAVGATVIGTDNYALSIARYNSNGSLDTSFGSNGISVADFSSERDDIVAVAIRPDGKIVVAGYCTNASITHYAMARYNPDGTIDTTFGPNGNGGVCGDFITILSSIALQPDGKIVASGYSSASAATSFSVFRFNENGSPDTNFGTQGRVNTPFFGNFNAAYSVALQPDGKIVAAGFAHAGGAEYDFAVARYLSNGGIDTSFGSSTGTVTIDVGIEDIANAVKLQSDGKIVLAGSFQFPGPDYSFGLVRLLPNGSLDTSFIGTGIKGISFVSGPTREAGYDVVVQPADGKIVAAGHAQTGGGGDSEFALVRLLPDGADDITFGGDGKVTHDFGGGSALAYALAIQSDGKLVAGGSDFLGTNNDYDYALARYLANDTATPTATPTLLPGVTPTVCAISFTDVPQGSTFYDFVTCIYCQGIIGGYETGCETGNPCFRPNNNLTRGQLAKIVSNAAGFDENFVTSTFEDVPVGSTFHQFVERLASRSIIGGYACGGAGEPCGAGNKPYFRPNANVTRGQTSKIVALAVGAPDPPLGQRDFEDVPTTHNFWQWIEALYIGSVISGYPCGGAGEPCGGEQLAYFRPNNNVTRGQSSKIITLTFFPRCGPQTNPGK